MNAVIYARYSSHNQTEQSIEGQLAAAYKYAATKGYTVIQEYCDRAKTGTNDNREAFQQMLKDTAKKQFEVIIVWKVDRFGRNREEITFNKYKAKKNGVRVEYVAENISDGPEGVILESVLEGMAEYYSKQLSQNVKRGLLESAKKHKVIGGHVPFGYRISIDKEFELDPEKAPVAKEIFERYANGASMAQLAKHYNSLGYNFTRNTFPRMLSNPKYKGTYVYKDLIRDEDAIPAIVSRSLFDRVQERLNINRRKPVSYWAYADYLLTDKLYCAKCGAPMVGKSGYGRHGKKYKYYVCTNQIKHTCDKKPVRKEEIEELVLTSALRILNDETVFKKLIEMVWSEYQSSLAGTKESVRFEKLKSDVEDAIANLIKSVEQGMPYDLVKDRLIELNKQKDEYALKLTKRKLSEEQELTKEQIVFFLEQFRDRKYENINAQRKLIAAYINSIYLDDDEAAIGLNYSDKTDFVNLMAANDSVRMCAQEQGIASSMRIKIINHIVVLVLPLP